MQQTVFHNVAQNIVQNSQCVYVARDVIQTVCHNVEQCLQNVKHNVVQAIVDNLAHSVIQCRTNVVYYIVHSNVQPMVHNVAQNVSRIHNALYCTQRYTN